MVALTERQVGNLEVGVLKMLKFPLGVTRMDRIRNYYISEGQLRSNALNTKFKRGR